MTNHKVKETIVRLLNNMGSESEIRKYLKRFSSNEGMKFAIIKVGGAILKDDIDNLVSSLSFLQQVGLTPIVVHGAGPQLNAQLEQEKIEAEFIEGKRVTNSEVLKVARKVFISENHNLVNTLKNAGVDAASFYSGIFECELENETLGLVGTIQSVHDHDLIESVRNGAIPVVSPLGETEQGQIVNINADTATLALAKAIEPYKVVFLTGTGGILGADETLIPAISLQNDYDYLMQQSWLHSGMKLKLQQIYELLNHVSNATSVSITKPSLVAKELFTDRGSGTLVNKGEKIHQFNDWQHLAQDKLTGLIESSFGHHLQRHYFEQTQLHRAYVTECYRAATIVTNDYAVPYLDKFVVEDSAKGEGLGTAVWNTMLHDNPQLFWRASSHNPINKFYFSMADGFIRGNEWNVFWRGVDDFSLIQSCVQQAINRPRTVNSGELS
ncbi:acetylglutamate kinase [Kangiella koreensis]|uniref:Acetylglutamate kinase n=1 Tax=Kangiella koreensis (strain DSM 16069 / JCM 12317 / KCTC 12182 / SW-125) TaxID=523791 RepID=C7R8V3_KANKD|nr:acetylglutamate kinase [Kangiella koreensis]ACV25966.1 acetylglutamate kinase [Kangiella koreensis DSM 16069]